MTTALATKITIGELVSFQKHQEEYGKEILEQIEHAIEKSQAAVIEIYCREDTVIANDQIGLLKAVIKNIEKKRLEHSRVVIDFRDVNNTWYKDFKTPLDEELLRITEMSGEYQRKCREEECKAEEERQAEIAKREALQEAHRAKGHEIDETPRAELVPEVADIKTVSALRTRKYWKYEILDESQIPRPWLCVDTTKIQRAITQKDFPIRNIPGVRIYDDEDVI